MHSQSQRLSKLLSSEFESASISPLSIFNSPSANLTISEIKVEADVFSTSARSSCVTFGVYDWRIQTGALSAYTPGLAYDVFSPVHSP